MVFSHCKATAFRFNLMRPFAETSTDPRSRNRYHPYLESQCAESVFKTIFMHGAARGRSDQALSKSRTRVASLKLLVYSQCDEGMTSKLIVPGQVRETLMLRVAFLSLALMRACFISPAHANDLPNIIYILCDDLAQGDLGCYGQKLIQTPRLDQMAAEGTRYTQAYSGTSVCAPSRASLMTGLHTGHSPVRANYEAQPEGQWPLPPGQPTLASVLKLQGYSTACVGKWGMGMFHTTGSPLKVGFDHFYGYNCQRHAHSYFPTYLYKDDLRFDLPGNDGKDAKVSYSQNYLADETLKWVRDHKADPFFLFYAATLPHNKMEIDDLGIYKDKPWTEKQKTYAAMVTRLDSDVGRLLDLLKELNLDKTTLVIFTGDNGSQQAPDSEVGKFFNESMDGKLRGFKRGLYEGGLRQAAISWWPGTVPAGRVSEEPWAFWDLMPTVAELAGLSKEKAPATDGLSLVSFFKGGPAPERESFYWELHEGPSLQAVRFGNYKAIRQGPGKPIELYNLADDVSEKNDIGKEYPVLVERAESLMASSHKDDPVWPMVNNAKERKRAREEAGVVGP
jgi:arylsulfatase A